VLIPTLTTALLQADVVLFDESLARVMGAVEAARTALVPPPPTNVVETQPPPSSPVKRTVL
jgi:hypothetical protein